jgi:tetratricopeptide (TPR) repeat protein
MARHSIDFFEQTRDESGLSLAWLLIANALMFRFSLSEVLDAAERAVHHARKGRDSRAESIGIDQLAGAMLYGPTSISEALDRTASFLEWARETENRSLEEGLLASSAQLYAHRGDFEVARSIESERRALLSDLGQTGLLPYVEWDAARISLLAGEAPDAEARLRASYEMMKNAGDMGHLSTAVLTLAEAVYRQGRYEEIGALLKESYRMGSADDGANRICSLCLRAKVLGRTGKPDEAERLIAEAVALSRRAGSPQFLGDSLMDMGDVLSQREETRPRARFAFQAALAEYERKGSLALAARARRTLEGMASLTKRPTHPSGATVVERSDA